MDVFLILLGKLSPLYLLIGLGAAAERLLRVPKETVARLLIYLIGPLMIFHGIATMELEWGLLLLTPIIVLMGVCLCLTFLAIGRRLFDAETAHLLAFGAGMGNSGYFGFPLVQALFPPGLFPVALLIDLGMGIYQHTFGAFIAARGNRTLRESIVTVLRLPMIYAMLAGLAWNVLGFGMPAVLHDLGLQMRGAYIVLGMMLIGMGLSAVRIRGMDTRYLSLVFAAKFLAWPVVMIAFIRLDTAWLHLFSGPVHQVLLSQAIVPVAANVVAYASEFRLHPAKAAAAVFATTVFACVLAPVAAALLF